MGSKFRSLRRSETGCGEVCLKFFKSSSKSSSKSKRRDRLESEGLAALECEREVEFEKTEFGKTERSAWFGSIVGLRGGNCFEGFGE